MAYSPTGITTSTANLPATINKMPVDANIGGPHYSSHPSGHNFSRPSSSQRPATTTTTTTTTTAAKPDPASSSSSSRSATTITTTTKKLVGVQDYSEVPESPPLTSFLTDRFAASTMQESVYLSRVRYLRIATYVVSGLIIACALGSLGTSAHVLSSYNSTRSTNASPILSLWPANIDIRPVLATLIPAAIISVLVPAYLLLAAIPSPHSRTRLLTYVCLLATSLTFILSIISLFFTTVITYLVDGHSHTNPRPTILSFTCSYYRGPSRFYSATKHLQLPIFGQIVYPSGFGRLCRESEASWGLMTAVAFLSLLGLLLVGLGFAFEAAISRERTARYEAKYRGGGGISGGVITGADGEGEQEKEEEEEEEEEKQN